MSFDSHAERHQDHYWYDFHDSNSVRRIQSNIESVECRQIAGLDAGSYEAAKRACIRTVQMIVRDCERDNEAFTDLNFDLERPECFESLTGGYSSSPGPHKRIGAIFEQPIFTYGAPQTHNSRETTSEDIRSSRSKTRRYACLCGILIALAAICAGRHKPSDWRRILILSVIAIMVLLVLLWTVFNPSGRLVFSPCDVKQSDHLGNCWWLAAVATLCSRRGDLIERICVAWDQPCGIYGFLFFRDGQWTYTVVDDYLYMRHDEDRLALQEEASKCAMTDNARGWHAAGLSGSDTLHFGKCCEPNHTWLPLLEKAYAKAHGDYFALKRGSTIEGIEDLTGGISHIFHTKSILDRNILWQKLRQNDTEHMYSISGSRYGSGSYLRGLEPCHAYILLSTTVYYDWLASWMSSKTKLLKLRNPWGRDNGLWHGSWGVGSTKWNMLSAFWLRPFFKLDGTFYISFDDALETFAHVDCTKVLIGECWTEKQKWVRMDADWVPQYNPTYFLMTLEQDSAVALVISQVDGRYFRELEGRYSFRLEVLVRKQGTDGEYVACAAAHESCERSVSIERSLEAGSYEVLVKVVAVDCYRHGVEETVRYMKHHNTVKLQQIAQNYNAAYGRLEVNEVRRRGVDQEENQRSPQDAHLMLDASDGEHAPPWNAVCGVGLRVVCPNPNFSIDVCRSDDTGCRGRNNSPHGTIPLRAPTWAADPPKQRRLTT